jgi:hypothetical protein
MFTVQPSHWMTAGRNAFCTTGSKDRVFSGSGAAFGKVARHLARCKMCPRRAERPICNAARVAGDFGSSRLTRGNPSAHDAQYFVRWWADFRRFGHPGVMQGSGCLRTGCACLQRLLASLHASHRRPPSGGGCFPQRVHNPSACSASRRFFAFTRHLNFVLASFMSFHPFRFVYLHHERIERRPTVPVERSDVQPLCDACNLDISECECWHQTTCILTCRIPER